MAGCYVQAELKEAEEAVERAETAQVRMRVSTPLPMLTPLRGVYTDRNRPNVLPISIPSISTLDVR
jgi:hypothetical protein